VGNELSLPFPWLMRNNITIKGQWLYPREAIARLIALAQNGILDLSRYDVVEFPLTDIEEALAHASSTNGPFTKTVVKIV
jgi:alcohol dehydrogenase